MKTPRLVCLDTHILIWGVKNEAESGQEGMIPRAQAFLRSLEEESARVFVPSVVLAELLVRVPPDRHAEIMQEVSKRFMIVPFDTPAASEFAKLFARWKEAEADEPRAEDEAKGDSGPADEAHPAAAPLPPCPALVRPWRNELKADLMILATAIVRNVACVYSHDGPLRVIAQRTRAGTMVAEIPEQPEQIPLPLPANPDRPQEPVEDPSP